MSLFRVAFSALKKRRNSQVIGEFRFQCALWWDFKAKIWFNATPGKNVAGEILKLYLF